VRSFADLLGPECGKIGHRAELDGALVRGRSGLIQRLFELPPAATAGTADRSEIDARKDGARSRREEVLRHASDATEPTPPRRKRALWSELAQAKWEGANPGRSGRRTCSDDAANALLSDLALELPTRQLADRANCRDLSTRGVKTVNPVDDLIARKRLAGFADQQTAFDQPRSVVERPGVIDGLDAPRGGELIFNHSSQQLRWSRRRRQVARPPDNEARRGLVMELALVAYATGAGTFPAASRSIGRRSYPTQR
jgi:hypothetical protein